MWSLPPGGERRQFRQINICLYVTSILLGFLLRQNFSYTFSPHYFFDLWLFPFYNHLTRGLMCFLQKGGRDRKTVQSCLFHGKPKSMKTLRWGGKRAKDVGEWLVQSPSPAREPSLSHLQGLDVVPRKYAASGGFLWRFLATLASFPHCEQSLRKILPLVHFLHIQTQRREDSEANDHCLLLWLSSPEV